MVTRLVLPLSFGLLAASTLALRQQEDARVIDAGYHHLGNDATPEWDEASAAPEGTRLDISFEAEGNAVEHTLIIVQRHVNDPWHLSVNGTTVTTLARGDALKEHFYPLPAGLLKAGENVLSIVPDVPTDDMTVGNIRLIDKPFREVFGLERVSVSVKDEATGDPIPARLTVTDAAGTHVPVYYARSPLTAVRDGIVYTANGQADFEVPRGVYRVFATRGSEWGLDEGGFEVKTGEGARIELAIGREVDTTGFVACDTHIHTFTFSGHGDATTEERMVTLAGEGVELAISTDHNHNTDYRPYQEKLRLSEFFTPVTGNEVTTPVGHFNGFPLDPEDPVPLHEGEDAVKIVEDIRAKGAKVVILNHPRWPDHEKGPFGAVGLDRFTGERVQRMPITVDATELINSDTEESDPLFLFVDWFALLNRGERLSAVGSSDSHTVGSPVGQGRTWVPSATDDPALIDVDEACGHIAAGRTSFGMGIFADVTVDAEYSMGDLVPVKDRAALVSVRVASPAWVSPERMLLFVNGEQRSETPVPHAEGEPTDVRLEYRLELAADHDAWLVCVVLGPGVTGPYWKTLNAYTLAGTNPVFLDVDGDGRYASPRETAQRMLAGLDGNGSGVENALEHCDAGVAIQLLHLVRQEYLAEAREKLLRVSDERAREDDLVRRYLEALPAVR